MLDSLIAADTAVHAWLTSHQAPLLDLLMLGASFIGRWGAVWLVGGVVSVCLRPRTALVVWQMALAVVLASLLTDYVLKPAVARPRPFEITQTIRVVGPRPETYAFPSGHAATAFAGAYMSSRLWRRARPGLWSLAGVIALSRVYLGVHYPLDVLGGALVGCLVAGVVAGRGPLPGIVPAPRGAPERPAAPGQ